MDAVRGRPRDAGVDERTLKAVIEELAAVGVTGFSVNSVILRSRVSKRSIAARWPDRQSLIIAGMMTLGAGLTAPRTGHLPTDLEALAEALGEVMTEPRRSVLLRCAAELQEFPQYYELFKRDSIDRSMAVVQDVMIDARRRGEIAAGLDLGQAAEFFVGAIFGAHALTSPGGAASLPSGALVRLVTRGLMT